MKKKLLKSITIALTLSIMPMTALHAMNEQQPNNNNNPSYSQRAWNYAKNLDYKSMALYGAGFTLAWPISIASHELGHAAMAEAIKPGSVEHIEILSKTPHVRWDGVNASPTERIAVSVAGPIAGALGSYAAAKGLQLLCSYQKKRTLHDALEETRNTSMLTPLSESPLVHGLQYGLAAQNFWDHGLNQMIATQYSHGDSDGLSTLCNIITMLPNRTSVMAFENISDLIAGWNSGITSIRQVAQTNIDLQNYLTHLNKQISRVKIGEKKLVLSPSILSNILLAQYYYDKDHLAGDDRAQRLINHLMSQLLFIAI